MRSLAGILCLWLAVTASGLSYVHLRVESMKLRYQIRDQRQTLVHLVDQHDRLRYNVARARTPQHLEAQLQHFGASDLAFVEGMRPNIQIAWTDRRLPEVQNEPAVPQPTRMVKLWEFLSGSATAEAHTH